MISTDVCNHVVKCESWSYYLVELVLSLCEHVFDPMLHAYELLFSKEISNI